MFFILSKVLWFFIQPINLVIFLLLAGLAAGLLGRARWTIAGATLACTLLVVCVWTSIGALMLNPLEERFPRPALPQKVDGIVMLGGGFEASINLARGGYDLNRAGDRIVETAVLARRFPEARIVISGGAEGLLLTGEADTYAASRLLAGLGIARERLVLEDKSRNTYENAVFTKDIVAPKPGETWLLVTSAFHMPRSKALFDKAGFATVPWPVDYRTSGHEGVGLFQDNATDSLDNATLAIREWIGLFAYWMSGKIDSPFPGPNG